MGEQMTDEEIMASFEKNLKETMASVMSQVNECLDKVIAERAAEAARSAQLMEIIKRYEKMVNDYLEKDKALAAGLNDRLNEIEKADKPIARRHGPAVCLDVPGYR